MIDSLLKSVNKISEIDQKIGQIDKVTTYPYEINNFKVCGSEMLSNNELNRLDEDKTKNNAKDKTIPKNNAEDKTIPKNMAQDKNTPNDKAEDKNAPNDKAEDKTIPKNKAEDKDNNIPKAKYMYEDIKENMCVRTFIYISVPVY